MALDLVDKNVFHLGCRLRDSARTRNMYTRHDTSVS